MTIPPPREYPDAFTEIVETPKLRFTRERLDMLNRDRAKFKQPPIDETRIEIVDETPIVPGAEARPNGNGAAHVEQPMEAEASIPFDAPPEPERQAPPIPKATERKIDAAIKQGAPKPATSWRDNTVTVKDLKAMNFPMMQYVVPGLLPAEGFHLLIAKAKIGKTWLMQDISLAASADRYTLGDIKPAQGDVLYLALEDNKPRLRRRVAKLLPEAQEWPDRMTIATTWRRLDQGGIEDMREWAKGCANPRMIVIDVLKMVKPDAQKNRNTQLYDADYDFVAPLRALAAEFHVCIVGIHHARKAEADDPIDMISGSGGLAAAADTILVITRGGSGVTLHVRGRDVEEADLAIEFNKATCRWRLLGSVDEVRHTDQRQRVIDILTEEAEPLTAGQIAQIMGVKRNTATKLLGRMVRDGHVEKPKAGYFGLASQPAPSRWNGLDD